MHLIYYKDSLVNTIYAWVSPLKFLKKHYVFGTVASEIKKYNSIVNIYIDMYIYIYIYIDIYIYIYIYM